MTSPGSVAPVVHPEFRTHTDAEGRRFEYALVTHGGRGLVVHFSAFFGRWGNARAYRDQFQGYFHRLKMLGSDPGHDWLFVCDAYGARANGTYYLGQGGDLFVERAMVHIVEEVAAAQGRGPDQVVTVGSSMGATGALRLGLLLGVAGVVAIVPHVDLAVAATACDRYEEVAFACPDGDPTSPSSRAVTRRVYDLLEPYGPAHPPPHLFVQSVADDRPVHDLQVPELVEAWRLHGGVVEVDVRASGGHTSDYATRALLLDAAGRLLAGQAVEPARYAEDPAFAGPRTVEPLTHRVRRRLHLGRLLRR